jgi:hypothetical protein
MPLEKKWLRSLCLYPMWLKRSHTEVIPVSYDWKGSHTEVFYLYPMWLKREPYRSYISTLCDRKRSQTEVIYVPYVTEKGVIQRLYLYPMWLKRSHTEVIPVSYDWKGSHTKVFYLYPMWLKRETYRSYIFTLCDRKRSQIEVIYVP